MESFILNPDYILSKLPETKEFLHWFPKSLIEGKRKQIIKFVINHRNNIEIKVGMYDSGKCRRTAETA